MLNAMASPSCGQNMIDMTGVETLLLNTLGKRKLDMYRPYKRQQEFHKAGKTYRERLLRAGNQLGKCVSYQTLIDLPNGTRCEAGLLFDRGTPFNVLSWDGEKIVEGQITHVIRKPAEQCYRVFFKNGRYVEAAAGHKILCADSYRFLSQLLEGVPCLPNSSLEPDQLAHALGALHSFQIGRDSQESCLNAFHLHDEPLREDEEDALVYSPSPDDALPHNCALCGLGVLGCKHTHIRQLELSPLSNQDEVHQNVGRYAESLYRGACSYVQYTTQNNQEVPRLSIVELSDSRLNHVISQYPLFSPFDEGNQIIAYMPVGVKSIYDFTVRDYGNYIMAGVVHHNTYAMAAEVAMHACGRYPEWWEGRVFKKAPVIWCAGVTGEVVRDTIQRLLIGDVANPGTGLIPPGDVVETMPSRGVADLVDTILVKHTSGATTRIRLKYYEQGREKFQADTVDMVWLDEEPDEALYMEALTRTNATGGCLGMTFTPLKGMSVVVRRFLNEPSPDRIDVNMTIDDALHIPTAERQKIIDSYPAHERGARIRGEPMLGSGAIFPIADEDIACDPFPMDVVPFFWLEIAGMDFGWDHPTAAAKALYNPQDDIIYITNTYRRREATPLVHASALKAWGNVPFAWPHDGLQHDKGSGVPLKEIYVSQGLRMLSDNARFEDGSNGVEAGIAEMLIRMETGKLKVFRNLTEFFDEKRMYHRREGKIWKEFDDIICSVRYLIMNLRYAVRVNRPHGMINGYPIDSMTGSDNLHTADYNPLGHKYIDKVLGLRK